MPSHLVTKLHHAALVGIDLCQMEDDVCTELPEEWDPITNQDRQDRIANFVGEPETETFAGHETTSNKPDGLELGPQAPIHELSQFAGVKLRRCHEFAADPDS
jgi:hypothetical protein